MPGTGVAPPRDTTAATTCDPKPTGIYGLEQLREPCSTRLPATTRLNLAGRRGTMWTGGTWHQPVETASHHIVRVTQEARRRGAIDVEVREAAAERWTRFARRRVRGAAPALLEDYRYRVPSTDKPRVNHDRRKAGVA
jgi:hypothetical protein